MRTDGVYLTEIRETDARTDKKEDGKTESSILSRSFQLPVRIPTQERAIATRQLATLVGAGIPVVESLGALVEQIEHSALRQSSLRFATKSTRAHPWPMHWSRLENSTPFMSV